MLFFYKVQSRLGQKFTYKKDKLYLLGSKQKYKKHEKLACINAYKKLQAIRIKGVKYQNDCLAQCFQIAPCSFSIKHADLYATQKQTN